MGKNHRHLKNVKAEKNKVKLKQTKTKFLPKGLNETKANYKIKQIVLSEQFKHNEDGLFNKQIFTVEELIKRLEHHNKKIRKATLEEFAELYNKNDGSIKNYNFPILCVLCRLMEDEDYDVRNALAKLLPIIIKKYPQSMKGRFEEFLINLKCAMTNIDRRIQEDSLKFLDCFLLNDCGFIAATSDRFLPQFLLMIYVLRNEKTFGKSLADNFERSMTNVMWRIQLLTRLHAVIDVAVKYIEEEEEKQKEEPEPVSGETASVIYIKGRWDHIFKPQQRQYSLDSSAFVAELKNVIPIFFDIWMEVIPEKNKLYVENGCTVLTEQAAAILSCIVNILYILWKFMGKERVGYNTHTIFDSAEANKVYSALLLYFPYYKKSSINYRSNEIKSNGLHLTPIEGQKCVLLNLKMCYLYFSLNSKFPRKKLAHNELTAAARYINKCLMENLIDQSTFPYLIEFVQLALLEKHTVWQKTSVSARNIFANLIMFYTNGSMTFKHKMKLLKMLADARENDYLYRTPQYTTWVATLPELICQSQINDSEIEVLLQLARFNCEPFLLAIRENLPRILSNLKNIRIILHTDKWYRNEYFLKRELAYILYYLRGGTCEEWQNIKATLQGLGPEYFSECSIRKIGIDAHRSCDICKTHWWSR